MTKFPSHVYDALIDALFALGHREHTVVAVADLIVTHCDSEEEIIKRLNSFGRIVGQYN